MKRTTTKSRTSFAVGFLTVLAFSAGCKTVGFKDTDSERVFLTVDFEPGRTLRYKFVSDREMLLDWDPNARAENRIERRLERLEMVTSYTPVSVDPYGISTIRAVCESVVVERSGRNYGVDAAEAAAGKTFSFTIDARGKILDRSELDALVKELGAKAFRSGPSGRRIKNPDMVGDFIVGQYFLWDAISSVENPASGVTIGQTWHSQLPVPLPMVLRKARDVTYRLSEIQTDETTRHAIIDSTYTLAEAAPTDWPVPYSGRFQVSGTFGFLGTYQVLGLEGAGRQSFDVDAGCVVTDRENYTVRMKAVAATDGDSGQPAPHHQADADNRAARPVDPTTIQPGGITLCDTTASGHPGVCRT